MAFKVTSWDMLDDSLTFSMQGEGLTVLMASVT